MNTYVGSLFVIISLPFYILHEVCKQHGIRAYHIYATLPALTSLAVSFPCIIFYKPKALSSSMSLKNHFMVL